MKFYWNVSRTTKDHMGKPSTTFQSVKSFNEVMQMAVDASHDLKITKFGFTRVWLRSAKSQTPDVPS